MRANEFITEHKIAEFRTGNLIIDVSSHTIDQRRDRRVTNRNIDRALFKLKFIKTDLETTEPGEKFWVDDPDTGISLGMRRSMHPNRYLFNTVVSRRTYDGEPPVFTLPSSTELAEEELFELSFLGSECTKDCSGHRAGYEWYKRKGYEPTSWSSSFNKGAALAHAGK